MDGGLLQETKAILRSYIVSSPQGLTIDGLARDYKKNEGQPIPFARLGFNKLETFLRSLTDTLVIHGTGSQARVTPIITKNLEHINNMIVKQKNATRERKMAPVQTQSNFRSRPSQQNPPLLLNPPLAPRFNQNANVPLCGAPGAVYYNGNVYPSQVPLLPTPIAYNVQYPLYQFNRPIQTTNPNIGSEVLDAFLRGVNTQIWSSNNSRNVNAFNSRQHRTTEHNSRTTEQWAPNNLSTTEPVLPNRTNECRPNSDEHNRLKNGNASNSELHKTTDYNFSVKEEPRTEPTLPNRTNDEYKQRSGEDNKLTNGNASSSSSHKTPKHFHAKQECTPKNEICIEPKLERTEAPKSANRSLVMNDHKANGIQVVDHQIKFKLQSKNPIDTKLNTNVFENNKPRIVKNSSALSLASVSDISNSSVKSTFCFDKFKKSFVEIQNDGNSKSSKEIEPRNTSKKAASSSVVKKQERASSRNKSNNDLDANISQEAVPNLLVNDIVFLIDYPHGCVKLGETISKSEIPKDLTVNSWFGIFITEVHSPYKFWFHLHKENHEVDTLMNDIESFYENLPSDELNVSSNHLKKGLVCAALFEGMWHRGCILRDPEQESVKVHFMDYGTVSDVHVRNIKYLREDFAKLEAQAFRGCLADIKPATRRWSRDSIYAFLDMVCDLMLYAKATEIDEENKVISMIVTDTNDDIDFQINEALIKKGYARYSPEPRDKSENKFTPPRNLHFQEKYPTFDMLETGQYPSFADIGNMLAKGIDFEERQDQNILVDIDEGCKVGTFAHILTSHTVLKDDDIEQDIPNDPRCTMESPNNLINFSESLGDITNAASPFHNNSTNPFLLDKDNSECTSLCAESRHSFDDIELTPAETPQHIQLNNQYAIPSPYLHQVPMQYSYNLHPNFSNPYAMQPQQFQPVPYTPQPLRRSLRPPPGFEDHVISQNLAFLNYYK